MHSAKDYSHPEVEDQQRRDRRLELLDLGPRDHAIAQRLHAAVIRPRLELIIAAFYDRLLDNQRFQEIMARGFDIATLRHAQSQYLLSLGIEFDSADYFDRRIRVGLVHDRVGVPLSLYQCAFRLLQQLLIDNIRAAIRDPKEQHRLSDFVLKITTLDMSLAIEAYHHVRMNTLEGSLQELGAQERIQRQRAQTDALTGLSSRARFLEVLARLLNGENAGAAPLCLAVADLDGFKQVNDRHGHLAGDAVLREVAARLRAGFRDFDLVARYGGEEFVIVLEGAAWERALDICERVRQRVAASPVAVSGLRLPITVSFGVAAARADDSVGTLFERADRAMYAAKAAGRNCVRSELDVARD